MLVLNILLSVSAVRKPKMPKPNKFNKQGNNWKNQYNGKYNANFRPIHHISPPNSSQNTTTELETSAALVSNRIDSSEKKLPKIGVQRYVPIYKMKISTWAALRVLAEPSTTKKGSTRRTEEADPDLPYLTKASNVSCSKAQQAGIE